MYLFDSLLKFVYQMADSMSLPVFVFVASFIEELVGPIPSPLVSTLAGALTAAQEQSVQTLFILAAIASVAKTLGNSIFYLLGDKGEDLLITRWGKFFGVTHKQVETVGTTLRGSVKDELVLLFLRAFPLAPSTPVSIIAGILKINPLTFIWTSLVGTFFRVLLFLYIGYIGSSQLERTVGDTDAIASLAENAFYIGLVTLLVVLVIRKIIRTKR